ncbi:MAG: nitrite reductase [Nocardioidaceae bacterium]|nr:nitrite reductase [Nocardioidaceae bacterium]
MAQTVRKQTARNRADRCPGVIRPWPASDGGLVRVRVPGGQVATKKLLRLMAVAEQYGDGRLHVTARANLQLRAMPLNSAGVLVPAALGAVEETGLVPSRSHDRVRNVLASPQSGRGGGRADLRPLVAALDRALMADENLARLPGRFLFTLDDGRGDLAERHCDLGVVALDDSRAQLRMGTAWGEVVPLADAVPALLGLAHRFLIARGLGPDAPWHVTELPEPLAPTQPPEAGAAVRAEALAYGPVTGGAHVGVTAAGLSRTEIEAWPDAVVITPWRGVFIPEESR